MSSYDVIVAGAGSMGSAACYHLARRGVRVLGLEQFDLPHRNGSHHGHSRMIRQSYYEHPDYVPLLRRAYELWDELEDEAGSMRAAAERILHLTGGLYLGPADGAIVPGALAAAREHGLPHELIDAADLRARFPAFRPPEGFLAFFEEQAGFLVPELAVTAHAEFARARGAEIRVREPILEWSSSSEGVSVRTASASYRAGHLILAGGAWNGALARDLAVELVVTRQVLAWFGAQGDAAKLALGSFPCWFIETDTPYGHYGFPMLESGQRGLKLALHKPGERIAPGAPADGAPPRDSEIAELRAVLESCIPDGDGPVLAACTCLYTNTADGHFVVGLHPGLEHVSIAAGFSGHGFKFASVMGEVLADLATEGRTRHPIDFLSPDRFA